MNFQKIEREIERCRDAAAFDPWVQRKNSREAAQSLRLLLDVARAAEDIKWRSIEKDNMEFATTCWKKDAITKALTALKGHLDNE